MMVVHPIAEDWRRRGHASEYSEPQLLIELAEKQTETELKEKRLLRCSAALSKQKAQPGVGKGNSRR